MRPTTGCHARRGFTLVELLLALTITMIALGIAMPFFMVSSRAVTAASGRLDAQLNATFALDAIDRDLRVAGVGTTARQPLLVYGHRDAIAFNADLATRIASDFGAVYYDPDALTGEVGSLVPARQIVLPGSPWTWPDSTYWKSAGVPSSAETISYWVEPDSQAPGLNRLMRRANDGVPRVLARGIKAVPGEPYFRYLKNGAGGGLVEINPALLPMRHVNGWHGVLADTGTSMQLDSVRLVRIRFTTVHRDPRTADATRMEERAVRITNAGLILASTCGEAPLAPTGVAVAGTGTPSVIVSWGQSGDEGAGEKDVERYAIFRRAAGALTFDEPIASIAAGAPPYTFTDTDVVPGQLWEYGIAAQDCTPATSPVSISPAVAVP